MTPEQRREELREHHGTPESVRSYDALLIAMNHHVTLHVNGPDVIAYYYRDRAAAEAYAASNTEHNNAPSLAIIDLPDGRALGITDLRPALTAAGLRSKPKQRKGTKP